MTDKEIAENCTAIIGGLTGIVRDTALENFKELLARFQHLTKNIEAINYDIETLCELRAYFGEHDKSGFDHRMYSYFDNKIKNTNNSQHPEGTK